MHYMFRKYWFLFIATKGGGGLTLMQFLQNALQCTAKHTKMLLKLNVNFEFHNHYILKVLD